MDKLGIMIGINDHILSYYYLEDDGIFPNSKLPVLLYKNVLSLPFFCRAGYIKRLFKSNNWGNFWRDGVFEYHHYHSVTHEVLGIYKGKTTLLLGGHNGTEVIIEKGDILVLPAGVAHKNLGAKNSVKCIGAYPDGYNYDMNYGRIGERPQTDKNIGSVGLPLKDPVFGDVGGIKNFWK